MHKLSVNLVVYNGAGYIPFVMASLKNQTFKDFEMIIVDNASTDGTIDLIKNELAGSGIEYRLIQNRENLGFSSGHNQAHKETRTSYFALLNADMHLMPDALQKMVSFLDVHTDTAAVAPRLMRWDYALSRTVFDGGTNIADAARQGFTSQIDAIGIRLFRNRRAVEWLTRQDWAKDSASVDVQKIYDKNILEVFGVSGAFAMYRKSVVDNVLLPGGNMFDPTYHSYKEDLDLAYRLRNAGFMSYAVLDSVIYHDRHAAGPKQMSDWAASKNKSSQTFFVSFHSYKNHLRTLYKNEYWQNFWMDFPLIFWYELKKFVYLSLTNPKVIGKGWSEMIKHREYTRDARRAVIKSRRMYWKGLRRWWL
jgi:GT2 family glycosyltransferase